VLSEAPIDLSSAHCEYGFVEQSSSEDKPVIVEGLSEVPTLHNCLLDKTLQFTPVLRQVNHPTTSK
jgi:hypothetical protein